MHFFGVFMQVHFEAKRYGLRGLTEEEMPKLRQSFRERWPTLIPLLLLISILASGRTPYLAAFTGITSCAIVGLTTQASGNTSRHWALARGTACAAAGHRLRRHRVAGRQARAVRRRCGRTAAARQGARRARTHRHAGPDRSVFHRREIRARGRRRGGDGGHRHRRGDADRRRLQALAPSSPARRRPFPAASAASSPRR